MSQCRFIPPRSPIDQDMSQFLLFSPNTVTPTGDDSKQRRSDYSTTLKEQLLPSNHRKVLSFHANEGQGTSTELFRLGSPLSCPKKSRRTSRVIPKCPDKILDAPDLVDDYYLNLLDWGRNNVLAVALGNSVFLWNATTGATQKLLEMPETTNMVTSVSWSQHDKDSLAVGVNDGEVQLWDAAANKRVRRIMGHLSRVSSLAWSDNTLSSGSRDSMIFHHDVRASSARAMCLQGHQQEVCGLRWAPNGLQLASGGNDNILNIWDARSTQARYRLQHHEAAVKAIAWCPFQTNLLASGGGTADRKIRFWNTGNGTCLGDVDTKSQVCALQWSVHDKELVSSHGFTHNQLILWKYESQGRVAKIAELTGHRSRVLHLAQSPDGTTIVSGAADETLRFWRIFGSPTKSPSKLKSDQQVRGMLGFNFIR